MKRLYKGFFWRLQKEMSVEKMGVDVEEVVLRTMFGVAQVETKTVRSISSEEHETYMITQCGAGEVGKCGLVSKAWAKEYLAWLGREEERVTEAMWERACGDALGLCCSMRYRLAGVSPPQVSRVGHVLVFEGREVVDVLCRRIGEGSKHVLGAEVTKGTASAGSWLTDVAAAVWSSRREWATHASLRMSMTAGPAEMDEALAQEREVVEGWETATAARLGAWVRATAAGL